MIESLSAQQASKENDTLEKKAGNPAEYFNMMRSDTDTTRSYIYGNLLGHVEHSVPEEFRGQFSKTLEDFQRSRDTALFLRPTTCKLTFIATGGNPEESELLVPGMGLLEVYNSSTYIFNCALDEKKGYGTKEKMKEAMITGNIYREMAERAIDDLADKGLAPEKIELIRRRLSKINEHLYIGQYFDLHVLTIDAFERGEFADDASFYKALEQRNEGFSGKFYSFVPELGGILSGAHADDLAQFGKIYGHCLQLANDMGDCFMPSNDTGHKEKPYKDTLSDLRNGRLTLPIYKALRHPNVDKKLLSSARFDDGERSIEETYEIARQISNHFVQLGIFGEIRAHLKSEIKRMYTFLNRIPKSPARDFIKGSVETSLLRNKWFKEANKLGEK